MRALTHWRTDRDHYFHLHPMNGIFSLLASMVLAGLVVLALVESVK
jgi:hypothetical protein